MHKSIKNSLSPPSHSTPSPTSALINELLLREWEVGGAAEIYYIGAVFKTLHLKFKCYSKLKTFK